MTKTIALVGALDTKGREYAFVKAAIERRGHRTWVIDSGVVGEPAFAPDVPAAEVAEAGGTSLAQLRDSGDRGRAIKVMARGAAEIVRRLGEAGRIDGVLSLGGSAGTAVGTAAMRALPLGIPKLMVSTIAAGDIKPYVANKDILMFPSVVDVSGINRISSQIYANAAGAIVGMVETPPPEISPRPLIAASMFGNTTILVDRCRELLEEQGFEVMVFHATGTGGQALEELVAEGYFTAVLDVTTTEWADQVVGGVLGAGPGRLDAAAQHGVPQVIAPGCVDMVNFWARETIPSQFQDRLFYEWNPNVTLMRTNPEENARIGRILAEKANQAGAPVAFFLPLGGLSLLDAPGQPFWWPEANAALFEAIKERRRPDIPVYELACNINDPDFAAAVSRELVAMIPEALKVSLDAGSPAGGVSKG